MVSTPKDYSAKKKRLEDLSNQLHENLVKQLSGKKRLAVVKAPPGSGKTFNLIRIVSSLAERNGWMIAIATQTNNQSNDLCSEFVKFFKGTLPFSVTRLGASGTSPSGDFPSQVRWINSTDDIPNATGVVIATSAKWATIVEIPDFDLLAIDEAWQMNWATLMQCADISSKYLLIGDPGQIPPVNTINVQRWGTSPRAPHKAAPEVVFDDPQFELDRVVGTLPSCRRLPHESVPYILPFYDFTFEAFAAPLERKIYLQDDKDPELTALLEKLQAETKAAAKMGWVDGKDTSVEARIAKNEEREAARTPNGDVEVAALIKRMSTGEPVLATIPTSADGPPAQVDVELARAIHRIVRTLITSQVQIVLHPDSGPRKVEAKDIGISASHRAMNGAILKALGDSYPGVEVDTPERWQGLQKPIMIAVHPLSGVTDPSEFDLSTGRLCVMASRHQVGLIFVSRDHVGKTIEDVIPSATQSPGEPDANGKGRRAHLEFWEMLRDNNRVVSLV